MTASKALKNGARAMFAVLILVMAYGTYYFPNDQAARYERNGQYFDLNGGTHSRAEYEHLKAWEKVFLASWGVCALTGLAAYGYDKLSKG
jgi:hypothetical protein